MAPRRSGCQLVPVLCTLLLALDGASAYATSPFPIGLAAAAELLEVTLPQSRAGVRAAYRKKAATAHPDVSPHADAAAQFLRITTAYETLLQFSLSTSYTAPSSAPDAGTASQSAGASQQSAASRYGDRPNADAFAHRVAAWRIYWAASLQAEQLASEAHQVAQQQATLARELAQLKAQLDVLLRDAAYPTGRGGHVGVQKVRQRGRAHLVDRCRAKYAECASKYAEAQSAVQTMQARVRAMREEASRLEGLARAVPA